MVLKQPFLEAIIAYCRHGILPLHTPGHKQGAGIAAGFKDAFERWGLQLDIDPPVLPSGESWVAPTALLTAAQAMAADLFGAAETFFLTNGTSAGIQAMFLAAGKQGKVVLPRQVHTSVISALIISDCTPIFVKPRGTSSDLPDSRLDPDELRFVLSATDGIRAVFTQNPSYYGFAADLRPIAQIAHEYQVPLLVDEAHGPHFSFSADLPQAALQAGADLVAQSTHKLLTSLTGSSMLHVSRAYRHLDLGRCVDLVQSTSPSFLLLASLEAAVFQLAEVGEQLVEQVLSLATAFRERVKDLPGITILGDEEIQAWGYPDYDRTKLVLDFSGLGLTGLEAAAILRQEYQIQTEMADFRRVLAILGPGDTEEGIIRLEQALRLMAAKYYQGRKLPDPPALPGFSELAMTPREAFFAAAAEVPLAQAAGMVAAEIIAPYPPGIPVVIPGEIITREQIQYLEELAAYGFNIAGTTGGVPRRLRVVI